ncbi:unnamed protein product [Lymnaea stagnalis]|uniref:Methyltransferase domain-containing protein n=1 Tax=Lymnaea stagnalis TaxID=6523 RepID=A0AAV2HNN3_LYMST
MATEESKAFKDKVMETINQSLVGMALGMASEVGIIDALVHSDKAMTSYEVAGSKQLKERYVRELLNCLVCAHIVDAEKADDLHLYRYSMSESKKSVFAANSLHFLGFICSTAARFQSLMECIQRDGPYDLPYNEAPAVVRTIGALSVSKASTEMDIMLQYVPGLKENLENGIKVIECGCGTALLISRLAQQFPNSTFTGSDNSKLSIQQAKLAASALNVPNLNLIQLDALNIPGDFHSQYDFVFVNDVIHDLSNPKRGLAEIKKLLKPGSYFAMIEIGVDSDVLVNRDVPGRDSLYSLSTFLCVPQAYVSEESPGLGCCWGVDTARRYIHEAGYKVVSQHPFLENFIVFVCQAI